MLLWQGDGITVQAIVESETPTSPRFLFPQARREHFAPHLDWLAPQFYDPAADRLHMVIQAFLVRTRRHTVLVDSCVGNGKPRANPAWNGLRTDWLQRLAAAGVQPAEVDLVLCTHLHVDHVGWNTRLENGHWVPTFPNARYVFSRVEWAHWLAEGDGEQQRVLEDSLRPVWERGQAQLVRGDESLAEGLRLLPTPGHTPGHLALELSGAEAPALITGDLLHHPIQMARPEWCSQFCVDPAQAVATRRTFLERAAAERATVLGTHFAVPSTGRVAVAEAGFRFLANRG